MDNIRIEIKWWVVFAIMGMLWMLLERLAGLHAEYIQYHELAYDFFLVPAVLIYILALLDKRKNYYNGVMTYQQGFISGLILTTIITLWSPVTRYIAATWIAPDFLPSKAEYAIETNMMTEQEAKNYYSLSSYIIREFLWSIAGGTGTAAIVALFVKRKE